VFRVRLGAPERSALPLPDKPSIAVLAFTNMSGDPEQEYFSDGIADDIITELSRCHSLFVIARNSSFTYKGRAVDIKQVARELGVRYVLEGSVRRRGGQVRVVVQLIDADPGNHIWAERYDRPLQDVFAMQDEITVAIATAIQPAVAEAEVRRVLRKPPENLGAWELYQRGLWHLGKSNPTDNEHAQEFFHRAIALDAMFGRAQAALAASLFIEPAYGSRPMLDGTMSARVWAQRACEADPSDAEAQATLAQTLVLLEGNYDAAFDRIAVALASNSNSFWANAVEGSALIFSGRPKEGRAALLRAERLSPHDPSGAYFLNGLIISHYFERDYAEAAARARRIIARFPEYPLPYRWLAAALGQLGQIDEAHETVKKALALSPQAFTSHVHRRPPWFRPEDHEHMLDGLRKAGWEAETDVLQANLGSP
jgi:adenylate cyclase